MAVFFEAARGSDSARGGGASDGKRRDYNSSTRLAALFFIAPLQTTTAPRAEEVLSLLIPVMLRAERDDDTLISLHYVCMWNRKGTPPAVAARPKCSSLIASLPLSPFTSPSSSYSISLMRLPRAGAENNIFL